MENASGKTVFTPNTFEVIVTWKLAESRDAESRRFRGLKTVHQGLQKLSQEVELGPTDGVWQAELRFRNQQNKAVKLVVVTPDYFSILARDPNLLDVYQIEHLRGTLLRNRREVTAERHRDFSHASAQRPTEEPTPVVIINNDPPVTGEYAAPLLEAIRLAAVTRRVEISSKLGLLSEGPASGHCMSSRRDGAINHVLELYDRGALDGQTGPRTKPSEKVAQLLTSLEVST